MPSSRTTRARATASSAVTPAATRSQGVAPVLPAVDTPAAPPPAAIPTAPARQPNFSAAVLVPSTTRFEDLPCLTPGSLGAGTICEPSRVFTGDAVACDKIPQSALAFRLSSVVTELPPVPGAPDFLALAVLSQADATVRSGTGAATFRARLALAGITEYAVRVALASGLLKESNGCVVLPTKAEVHTYARTEVGAARRDAAAGGGGALQPPPILGGGGSSGPQAAMTTAAAAIGPPSTAAVGAGASTDSSRVNALPQDDADLIDLFTTPHANYEVRVTTAAATARAYRAPAANRIAWYFILVSLLFLFSRTG